MKSDFLTIAAPKIKGVRDFYRPDALANQLWVQHKHAIAEQKGWCRRYACLDYLDSSSPKSARNALETIGKYFRREFGYDSPPYSASESINWRSSRLFVWLDYSARYDDKITVVGGCGIYWREYKNLSEGFWELGWIWLHPYYRRQGLFSSAWPFFLSMHDRLLVSTPLSQAMAAFLTDKPHDEVFTTGEKRVSVPVYTKGCSEITSP